MQVKGIIFDFDGTLADTSPIIFASFDHSCRKVLGHTVDRKDFIRTFGQPLRPSLEKLFPGKGGEICDIYRAYQQVHHDELIRPFPGVRETLESLRERGIRMAVVTSKFTETALRGMNCVGIASFFEDVIGAEKITRPKPDPQPCLEALDILGVDPSQCLCVGDSPYDLVSGKKAGCTTVAVDYSLFERDLLHQWGNPDHTVSTMPDLLPLIGKLEGKAD